LAIDEAQLEATDERAHAVLVDLRTKAKFVFGKTIEAACRRADLPDSARLCVIRARGADAAAECTGGTALVVAAREEIARRLAGQPPTIPPSPGGADCAAFAEHVIFLVTVEPENADDVRLAMAYSCANGEYTEPVIACMMKAATVLEADECDPSRATVPHPSVSTPSAMPPRAPPDPAPGSPP
jgi:hypothetical protein